MNNKLHSKQKKFTVKNFLSAEIWQRIINFNVITYFISMFTILTFKLEIKSVCINICHQKPKYLGLDRERYLPKKKDGTYRFSLRSHKRIALELTQNEVKKKQFYSYILKLFIIENKF
jgi:hypothetical protein